MCQLIGGFLISLPFQVMFYFMRRDLGTRDSLIIFGLVATLLACVYGGMHLILHGC
jgi:hypothetical protein